MRYVFHFDGQEFASLEALNAYRAAAIVALEASYKPADHSRWLCLQYDPWTRTRVDTLAAPYVLRSFEAYGEMTDTDLDAQHTLATDAEHAEGVRRIEAEFDYRAGASIAAEARAERAFGC